MTSHINNTDFNALDNANDKSKLARTYAVMMHFEHNKLSYYNRVLSKYNQVISVT